MFIRVVTVSRMRFVGDVLRLIFDLLTTDESFHATWSESP